MYTILPHPAIEYEMENTPGVLVQRTGVVYQFTDISNETLNSYANQGSVVTYTVNNNIPAIHTELHENIKNELQNQLNHIFGRSINDYLDTTRSNSILFHIPIVESPSIEYRQSYDTDDMSTLFLINDTITHITQTYCARAIKVGTIFNGTKFIEQPSTAFKKAASRMSVPTMTLCKILTDTSTSVAVLSDNLVENMTSAKEMVHKTHRFLSPETPQTSDLLNAAIGIEDGKMVKITDPFRLQYQPIKTGKAMRLLFPDEDDHEIKNRATEIEAKFKPPEFKISFERDDIRRAYRNGPSSCMTYANSDYPIVNMLRDPSARPTDALANGDIGVAYLERADGKITSRTLIVESKKAWVRLYDADFASNMNNREVLREYLLNHGYNEKLKALCGQHLLKIQIDPDDANGNDLDRVMSHAGHPDAKELETKIFLAPYIDWHNPALIEHEESLEVSDIIPDESDWRAIKRKMRLVNTEVQRAGVVYYAHGGLVTYRIDQETQTRTNPTTETTGIEALVTGSMLSLSNSIIQRIEEVLPGSGENPVYISPRAGCTTASFDEVEAAHILELSPDDIIQADTADGEAYAPMEDTDEGPTGDRFVTDDANELGYVMDDIDEEWIHEIDSVNLHDGMTTHRAHAVYVEDESEYYADDDDDIVRLSNGDYCLRERAYRLPNGEYIHEDDLERA